MNSCLMMAVSPQSFAKKPALYSSKQPSDDGFLHGGDDYHETAVCKKENKEQQSDDGCLSTELC